MKTTQLLSSAVKIENKYPGFDKETGRLPNSDFFALLNYSYITYKDLEFAKAIHANIIYINSNKLINPILYYILN